MSAKPKFAVRTIRDGKVRIRGKVFEPEQQHRIYAGEFDNRRWAFGLYYLPNGELQDYVSLWGSERNYRSNDEAEQNEFFRDSFIDGVCHWQWWQAVYQ